MCYQAFVEFFTSYSQLNFAHSSLEVCVKSLISHCKTNLKLEKTKDNNAEEFVPSEISVDFNPIKSVLAINQDDAKIKSNSNVSVYESLELPQVAQGDLGSSLTSDYLKRVLKKHKKTLFPIFF